MDGLVHVAGAGPFLKVGGKDYLVKAIPLSDRAMIEAEILQRRLSPEEWFETANLPQDLATLKVVAEATLSAATQQGIATALECEQFLSTLEGIVFMTWLMVRHADPRTLTLRRVTELIMADLDELYRQGGEPAFQEWRRNIIRTVNLTEGHCNPHKILSPPPVAHRGKKADEQVNWALVIKQLCTEYHLTPAQVLALPISHINILLSSDEELKGEFETESLSEMQHIVQRSKSHREQLIQNMIDRRA